MTPERLTSLPQPMLFELGVEPEGPVCAAALLVTTDDDGTPRTAILSPAQVRALDGRLLELRVGAASTSAANARSGRPVLLWCVFDGAAYSIRGAARARASDADDVARFELPVEDVLRDFSPSAPMIKGPTYRRT